MKRCQKCSLHHLFSTSNHRTLERNRRQIEPKTQSFRVFRTFLSSLSNIVGSTTPKPIEGSLFFTISFYFPTEIRFSNLTSKTSRLDLLQYDGMVIARTSSSDADFPLIYQKTLTFPPFGMVANVIYFCEGSDIFSFMIFRYPSQHLHH